ncbi:2-oxoacid:acceptor oxidoreductase subunit alpha [Candidatus Gottesmanbacteria bacterium]|nr:2-oxoacid:acceptor oxidoreductase subunit alpha [Candidatus Gottesmanbacteria bacterium]
MSESITWKIGGEAGFGIMTTGTMLSKLAVRSGFHIFDYVEYPSLIRGGHNVQEVRYSGQEVFSQERKVDLLVALTKETVDLHKKELKEGAGVIYDNEKITIEASEFPSQSVVLLPVPFTKIIKDSGVSPVMQNNIALGVSSAFLGFDLETLFALIADTFSDKGDKVVSDNKKAAQLGFEYVSQNLQGKFSRRLTPGERQKKLVVTANDAVGLGAIAAGCSFYAGYPMSPSSSLLHFMAAKAEKVGMVVKHAEDEISVINMAIGASYAGVRSMIGTAGGGFSLMVEGLGLAGLTETPLVIFMGQRPGPATGLPTWTGQADLQFLVHASQDEFPRIILAPGDVTEAFYLTIEAFNLADLYQTPVFILSDKYLAESHKSTAPYDTTSVTIDRGKLITNKNASDISNYKRYIMTEDGISPRVAAGTKGTYYLANSYEHDETSLSTEESLERIKQVDKRNKKLKTYQTKMPIPKIYGEQDADITLIGWGSTKGPVLQALSDLNYTHKGRTVNFLHISHVWPLNTTALSPIFAKTRRRINIEGNSQAQMAHLIREHTGVVMDDYLLKYDGRPLYPEEIISKLDQVV